LGGLSQWHLTLPTGPSTKATQINQPQLARYNEGDFVLTPEGVRMRAYAGGARTSTGTAYSRSELRERYKGPGALSKPSDSWPCTDTPRSMVIEQRLTRTTVNKPEVSIGQIHDDKNDLLELRYQGPVNKNGVGTGNGLSDTGKVAVHWNNDTSETLVDSAYTLGDLMRVEIVSALGVMTVTYENKSRPNSKPQTVSKDYYESIAGGCFFKAGMYVQACSITDLNGAINEQCQKKGWVSGRYETDPAAFAELLLLKLALDE
jgi:hypothetical protein